jgi:hypothetical protein
MSTAATVTSRLFARRQAGELDRQRHRSGAAASFRRVDRDFELARRLVDAEPGEAERAAGHALLP